MNLKSIIKKYIYVIVPLILLILNVLILKAFDGGFEVSVGKFYLIMIILLITPLLSLIIEIIGFVKALRICRMSGTDETYNEKRSSIKYLLLHIGALLITAVWFSAMLYLVFQYYIHSHG